MAAARAAGRANQNAGLDLMFALRTAAVAARFQARMAMPYDAATMAQNILRPQNPNVPTNITPPDHIRLGWIVGPFQVQPDGTLPGAYGRSITHYCRMMCEYVNRNNAPPPAFARHNPSLWPDAWRLLSWQSLAPTSCSNGSSVVSIRNWATKRFVH